MTDQEINEAVAELCGWKKHHSNDGRWKSPDGRVWLAPHCYASDLHSCAEFEKLLGIKQQNNYAWHLRTVLDRRSDDFSIATAPARKRCEALLRMHGEWRDE